MIRFFGANAEHDNIALDMRCRRVAARALISKA
jgi:hypothetical protein